MPAFLSIGDPAIVIHHDVMHLQGPSLELNLPQVFHYSSEKLTDTLFYLMWSLSIFGWLLENFSEAGNHKMSSTLRILA